MRYEKPIVNVIDLQIKENIAAVETSVYKGATVNAAQYVDTKAVALKASETGLAAADGLVAES